MTEFYALLSIDLVCNCSSELLSVSYTVNLVFEISSSDGLDFGYLAFDLFLKSSKFGFSDFVLSDFSDSLLCLSSFFYLLSVLSSTFASDCLDKLVFFLLPTLLPTDFY